MIYVENFNNFSLRKNYAIQRHNQSAIFPLTSPLLCAYLTSESVTGSDPVTWYKTIMKLHSRSN